MEAVEEKTTAKGRPRLLAWVCRAVLAAIALMLIGYAVIVGHETTRSVQAPDAKTIKQGAMTVRGWGAPTYSTVRPKDEIVISTATLALVIEGKQDLIPRPERERPDGSRELVRGANEDYRNVVKTLDDYWAGRLEIKGDPYQYFVNLSHSMITATWVTNSYGDRFKKEDLARIKQTLYVTCDHIGEAMLDCLIKQRRWFQLAQFYKAQGDWETELYYLKQMGGAGRNIIITRVTERCIDSVLRHVRAADGARMKAMKG